jgi:hypothetical protein
MERMLLVWVDYLPVCDGRLTRPWDLAGGSVSIVIEIVVVKK